MNPQNLNILLTRYFPLIFIVSLNRIFIDTKTEQNSPGSRVFEIKPPVRVFQVTAEQSVYNLVLMPVEIYSIIVFDHSVACQMSE